MNSYAPFARPLYVMAKPAGSLCNLACKYCYYLEKTRLYSQTKRVHDQAPEGVHAQKEAHASAGGPSRDRFFMSERTLEEFVRQYIESQTQTNVLFTWHGGEPLMRPLSFYKQVLRLQRQYAGGRVIDNCLQTNGTMLTDEWCDFLHRNHWLVGISVDGPRQLHDAYRKTRGGGPSFDKVMRGIELLKKHDVAWNVMGVVNRLNGDHPLDVYHFYKDIGCQYIQFSPVVERLTGQGDSVRLASTADTEGATLADYSVSAEQYGRFCCAIFDEWVRQDVGRVFVQLFDATLACWMGVPPGVCSMAETCGHAGVMAHNGDVYACDHFVFPEFKLGNIHDDTITGMMYSSRQTAFGRAKRDRQARQCLACEWRFACNGGCPKDRILAATGDDHPQNYLCEGYRLFFSHVAPYMDFMKHELLYHRPPANVMTLFRPYP